MTAPAALLVTLGAILADPALSKGARGARKIGVTYVIEESEREGDLPIWAPPESGEKCPVLLTPGWEVAVFNQDAKQDRHFHPKGTEFYSLIEGEMAIEVEGVLYNLCPGDMIIISPGTIHEVLPGKSFIARVITLNPDKIIV